MSDSLDSFPSKLPHLPLVARPLSVVWSQLVNTAFLRTSSKPVASFPARSIATQGTPFLDGALTTG